ncbi:MAG: efflux RND transporter permease subunit [Sandaracinaceae bacterium]|nr:efflux RND transporter permease subunit [Sandaracinaceae bacterium]
MLASTATTAAVFVPVIAWEGEVGQLLRDVAVAISFAIVTSLWVSVWVIPSLATRLKTRPAAEARSGAAARARRAVGRLVGRVARSAPLGLLTVTAAVGGSVALAAALLPPLEYLPSGNRNLIFGMLTPPPGTSIEDLDRVARRVQTRIAEESGQGRAPAVGRSFFVGSPERLFAGATADDPAKTRELLAWLRGVQSSIPGFFSFTTQASLFGRRGGSRSIEIHLTGRDLGELTAVGGRLMAAVNEALPGAQVRPEPSLDAGAPELRAYPRRREAASLGMPTDELGLTVDALVDGAIVGEVGLAGEAQLDVLLRARRASGGEIADPEALASAPVFTPAGEAVPLSVLADLREQLGPTVIRRIERRRGLTLTVSPPEEIPLESAITTLHEDVLEPLSQGGSLPAGVSVTVSGSAGISRRPRAASRGCCCSRSSSATS